jgi:hypothetical protein
MDMHQPQQLVVAVGGVHHACVAPAMVALGMVVLLLLLLAHDPSRTLPRPCVALWHAVGLFAAATPPRTSECLYSYHVALAATLLPLPPFRPMG